MTDKTEPAEVHKLAKKAAHTERYPFTKPGGEVVTIEHNLETGETKIVGKED